jgi:hypothetical protein
MTLSAWAVQVPEETNGRAWSLDIGDFSRPTVNLGSFRKLTHRMSAKGRERPCRPFHEADVGDGASGWKSAVHRLRGRLRADSPTTERARWKLR